MLAETVKLSGGEVLIILVVLFAMLAVAVATMAGGCLFAWRAGRGSQWGLALWIVCATIEAAIVPLAVTGLFTGRPNVLLFLPVAALAAQVALYLGARSRERAAP